MNLPNLLLDADGLQRVSLRLGPGAVEAVERDPLPPLLLVFQDRLPRDGIEHVVPLAGEPLEVLRNVHGQVEGRGPGVRLGLLLFPPRVEEFDCDVVSRAARV